MGTVLDPRMVGGPVSEDIEYGQWVVGRAVGGKWYGGRWVGKRLHGHPDHGPLVDIDINPSDRYTYCVGVRLDTVEKVDGYEPTWAPSNTRSQIRHALSFNGYGMAECGKRIGFEANRFRSALARHLPADTVYCPECRALVRQPD